MKKIHLLLLLPALLAACQGGTKHRAADEKPTLTVTIEPLRYLTEAVAGEHFRVVTMVPKGSSPESYDPTPQQLVELARSKAYLRIGYIGFEQAWMEKLADNTPHLPFYDLSKGVDLIRDESHPHPHHHADEHPGNYQEEEHHHHHHAGGVEPHIWNSALNAQLIAGNILDALCSLDAEHAGHYKARHDSLIRRMEQTDSLICARLSAEGADRAFMIYHPALSYFARDYGLHQIPIENGGKEPSPAQLKELVNTARREQVRVVFVQPEFDRRNAEIIAREIGARVVSINPLAYNWEEEMLHTADILSGK
ncbi:MAG: zinc ABC transporter substrate-binding protein [Bacteroides sp.]|nr:zinc ABC transporter substrate-binding protein [Bacteroides sp.]